MTDPTPQYERRSDVDGYTIVFRKGRSSRVHLLRSWGECNVEQARKSGTDVLGIAGSRENLLQVLDGKATWCRRCFPTPTEALPPTGEVEYIDPLEVA